MNTSWWKYRLALVRESLIGINQNVTTNSLDHFIGALKHLDRDG
jgi:hypothetical protein